LAPINPDIEDTSAWALLLQERRSSQSAYLL
jgi:hypothetical protein